MIFILILLCLIYKLLYNIIVEFCFKGGFMAKVKEVKKNIHEGHRMRLLRSYSQIEFDVLSPHQVLEFILFYIIPRGDVNPLAHRLLDYYGSVQNVLEANPNELMKIQGMQERSALMLTGIVKIFNYYTGSKLAKKLRFTGPSDIYDFCEDLLRFYTQEVVFAIAMDASFHVITKRKIGNGAGSAVALDPHDLVDFINETKAVNIVITHNHPGGNCKPTENDVAGTEIVKQIVEFMKAQFVDHVIIGDDGIYSIASNQKIRSFTSSEGVKELAENLKEGQ